MWRRTEDKLIIETIQDRTKPVNAYIHAFSNEYLQVIYLQYYKKLASLWADGYVED